MMILATIAFTMLIISVRHPPTIAAPVAGYDRPPQLCQQCNDVDCAPGLWCDGESAVHECKPLTVENIDDYMIVRQHEYDCSRHGAAAW